MDAIQHIQKCYHLTFGTHEPVLKIQSGQVIRVSVPDCDGLGQDGLPLPPFRFEQNAICPVAMGNPVAGPYYIEGARPGDSVEITILSVKPDRRLGRTGISARQIHSDQRYFQTTADLDMNVAVPRKIFHWDINLAKGTAIIKLEKSGDRVIEIPLSPFAGCIAVAPANGQFFDTLSSGNFGGNMDVPALTANCHLTLPVFADGACLYVGDLHAAQGEGEIIGGAIETSGIIEFSTTLKKCKAIAWPRVEVADRIGVIVSGVTLDDAIKIANAQLVLWMAQDYGFDRWEALNVLSQVGTSRPGHSRSVYCSIEKKYLK